MRYRAELGFFRKAMEKLRIQSTLLLPAALPEDPLDFGLRKFLGREQEYHDTLRNPRLQINENTVYKVQDAYSCSYIFFLLPDSTPSSALLLGPYLTEPMLHQQILEMAEQFAIPPGKTAQLEDYYINIPVIADDSALFAIVNVLAETLWGEGSAYEIVDLDQETLSSPLLSRSVPAGDVKEDTLLQMKIMEDRYAYENELMENVGKGLSQRAEHMLFQASQEFMTHRSADPLRSLKNYCIICNTLMRKAAERGGVHPFHLDRISSAFAAKIEAAPHVNAAQALMSEMTHAYCRQVRKLSTAQYSPLIRKVVSHIDADLSGDLSLKALSAAHSINPSYLSTLFRKETGATITEYISRRRMEQGAQLLKNTRLQVQTIAQHCGISDTNYFSKVFKKQYGMTPKQFRESSISAPGSR